MSSDSPLADVERQAGAVFLPDPMNRVGPAHFGNPHGEYAAARSEAAVFDFLDRTHVELTGRDRQKFLHNFCTNEIRGLQPGAGCEAFVTSVQGKVLAHIFVFSTPHSLWIESVPGVEQTIVAHLSKYAITEDVEFHPRSATWGELFVTGGDAAGKLASLGVECGALAPFGHRVAEALGPSVFIRRVDLTGQAGFLLLGPRDALPAIWKRLVENGIRPAGHQAFHALRIEAATPFFGLDITESNLAQEVARTADAICFTKGCYLGQEPIARIDSLGHVNQELRGLRLSAGALPAPGSLVMVPAQSREIGKITSSAISFENDLPVALAYLKRNYVVPGTEVKVISEGQELPGTVFWR